MNILQKTDNKAILRIMLFFVFLCAITCKICYSSWSSPITLSPKFQTSEQPRIAINNQNNVLVIWRLFDGDSFRIVSAQYNYTTNNWTATANLTRLSAAVNNQGSCEPQLAMDASGNALAVWQLNQGINSCIQASRYDTSTKSWDSILDAETLSDTNENAYAPQIALAMDTEGNAFAIWQRAEIIQAAHYDSLSGWQLPATNLSETTTVAVEPDVAISTSGNATAVWTFFDSGSFRVQASSYSTGSWTPATLTPILSDPGQNAYAPRVAMDDDGNALAVWYRYNNNGNAIIQTSYKAVGSPSWSIAQDISDAGQDAFFPQVAMNSDGNALIVWHRFDGTIWRIQARHRDNIGSWSSIYNVSSEDYDAFIPIVAMDSQGNGTATWKINDSIGNTRIQVAYYNTTQESWAPVKQQPIISAAKANADYPHIVMNKKGNAAAVWQRFDGRNWRIQTSRY